MAFGTGMHETTQMMLKLLEEHVRPGMSVLDIGTGSGILAIAAAKSGAGRIVAHDIDPVAVQTAARNAQKNSVRQRLVHERRRAIYHIIRSEDHFLLRHKDGHLERTVPRHVDESESVFAQA